MSKKQTPTKPYKKQEKLEKLTPEAIEMYRSMDWQDLYQEEKEAFKEQELENAKGLTEEEQKVADKNMELFLGEYRDVSAKRFKDLYQGFGQEDETEQEGDQDLNKIKVKVKQFNLKLPDSLSQLNPKAEEDMFYYMPEKIREYVVHHEFVIEILSFFISKFLAQPEKNKFKHLEYMLLAGTSCGLFFRKMYVVKCNYAVVFFNFSDRTDDVTIEEYKKNSNMVAYEEGVAIEKKISEMEARKHAEETEDERFGYVKILKSGEQDSVYIKEEEVTIDKDQVSNYIYTTLAMVMFLSLEPNSVPMVMRDNISLVLNPKKYLNIIKCKMHKIYFLPTC